MRPDLLRTVLGVLGLAIGFTVYPLVQRAPGPWPDVLIGALFVGLGLAAWFYARGEGWIRVLGALLTLYGVARMLFLH